MICRSDVENKLARADELFRKIKEQARLDTEIDFGFSSKTASDELRTICIEILGKKPSKLEAGLKAKFMALLFHPDLSYGLEIKPLIANKSRDQIKEMKNEIVAMIKNLTLDDTVQSAGIQALAQKSFPGEILHVARTWGTSLLKGSLNELAIHLNGVCRPEHKINMDPDIQNLLKQQTDDWLETIIKNYPNIARTYNLAALLEHNKLIEARMSMAISAHP